ncbi:MAG: response regulator [Deltaproteobacteria bacterium]|nr:response regulator [Deltaproteobacteria bacterium]
MATQKVLLVEDDNALRETLKDAISGAGYAIAVVRDGAEALATLDEKLPDVLVTDILLPEVSGLDLVESLRSRKGGDRVQVIMMSGIYRGTRHRRNAREKYGVEVYLQKPFDLQALVLQLDALVQEKQVPDEPSPFSSLLEDPFATSAAVDERKDVEEVSAKFKVARSKTKAPPQPGTSSRRGSFVKTPFPELLAQLFRGRVSGALMIKHGRGKKIIYLEDGVPTFVKSNLLSECLGRILVRERMISEDECKRSLDILDEAKKRGEQKQQGAILIDLGVISPHNLVYALTAQLEAKLFDIFAWGDGRFQFSEKIEIPPQSLRLELTLANILLDGVRQHFSDGQLQQLLAPYASQKLQVHEDALFPANSLPLEADERMFLSAIDGERSTAQLLNTGLLEPAEARVLLYTLLAGQMIQSVAHRRSAQQGSGSAAGNDATVAKKEIREAVSLPHPGNPTPPLKVGKRDEQDFVEQGFIDKSIVEQAPPSRVPPPRPLKKGTTRKTPPARPERPREPKKTEPKTQAAFVGYDVRRLRNMFTRWVRQAELESPIERLRVFRMGDHDVNVVEIERAYQSELSDLNSEAVKAAPSDVRAMAKNLKQLLDDAYETLCHGANHVSNATLKAPKKDSTLAILTSSRHFQEGKEQLEKSVGHGDNFSAPSPQITSLRAANRAFQEALLHSPGDGEIQSYLAWSQFRLQEIENGDAGHLIRDNDDDGPEAKLEKGIALCPQAEFPRLFHATMLLAKGEAEAAKKSLQQALLAHPNSKTVQEMLQNVSQELARVR